jgi:hypothetical protein
MSEAEKIVSRLLENDPDNIDPQEYAFQAKDEFDREKADLLASGFINAKVVQHLRQGQTIYNRLYKNADGTAVRAKITSIKRWKTRPNDFLIAWKHGMYQYGTIGPADTNEWTTIEPPPIPKVKKKK